MVLIRYIALLSLVACMKVKPPVQARVAAEVATTVNLATVDRARARLVPPAMTQALSTALAAHNLQPVSLDAPASFETRRTTAHRLQWLAEQASTSPHLLLVETTAIRYGEIQGRYRWAVDVTLTMAPQSAQDSPTEAHFSVPVYLQHAHHDAQQALRAAAPSIARHTRRLVNDYLGGAR